MNRNVIISNVILALCEMGVGVLLLVNPIGFTTLTFVALGIALTVTGIAEIVSYFRADPVGALVRQSLAIGLAEIAAGLFCIFKYDWFIVTFPLLTILYGVVILLAGFSKIQWTADMIRLKQKKWFWAALSAALSIVCAWVILSNPFASTAALWMFVAVSLIVGAVVDIIVLIFRRRA